MTTKPQSPKAAVGKATGLLLVLIAALTVVGVRNIVLRARLADLQTSSYVSDAEELARRARVKHPDARVVVTGPTGVWDRQGKQAVKLVRDLTIGVREGDPNKIFFRPGPVIADRDGNIYVAEYTEGEIRKFDQNGEYLLTIGRKGEGPGEFQGVLVCAFDSSGNLWVDDYGNQRLSEFTASGRYVKSIPLATPSIPYGFAVDTRGRFYLSFYDPMRESVIHRYNREGKWLVSFGAPVVMTKELIFARSVKRNVSAGPITLDGRGLYFSRANPYEIAAFGAEGLLRMKVVRRNSVMPSATVRILGRQAYRFYAFAKSTLVGVLDEKLINWVVVPEHLSSDIGSVVDLFAVDGRLLSSLSLPERVWATFMDTAGHIYGVSRDEVGFPHVVRYRLEFLEQ
jgi:hypothetical protein